MTIKEFNRTNCRTLMAEVEAALKPIAEKHGLTLDRKGRTFYRDQMPVMFQFLVTQKDEDGNALSAAGQEFKKNAFRVGLEPDDLGKEFMSRGEKYRITGLNLRRRKYPISAERLRDGKSFKFGADTVKFNLQRAA
jgi:hypothetical protein